MQLNIYLFATLKDRAGANVVSIEVPSATTVGEVRAALAEAYPDLAAALPTAIAAVNHEYVYDDHVVESMDEVAFFPPVSGGTHYPELSLLAEAAIDFNALTQSIVTPDTGAVALFSGYVRGFTEAQDGIIETSRLEYEAYAPMATIKMAQVIQEIRENWPLVQGIAIVQRVGTLQISEPTILIACAAAHRDQGCFEAARYGIDRLKEIVPVWKKEIGPDGTTWVEGPYKPTPEED